MEETILHIAFSDDGLSEAISLTNEEENKWEDHEGKRFFFGLIRAILCMPKRSLSKFLQKKLLYQNKDGAFVRFWLHWFIIQTIHAFVQRFINFAYLIFKQ